jgi:hypothetical protein
MTANPELLSRAWYAYRAGDHAGAAALYQQALQADPDNADSWCLLGIAQRAGGRPEDAAASHREALRLKPDFIEAWSNLGNALVDAGQPEEALAAFAEALGRRPDYAEAHNNRAGALSASNQQSAPRRTATGLARCRRSIIQADELISAARSEGFKNGDRAGSSVTRCEGDGADAGVAHAEVGAGTVKGPDGERWDRPLSLGSVVGSRHTRVIKNGQRMGQSVEKKFLAPLAGSPASAGEGCTGEGLLPHHDRPAAVPGRHGSDLNERGTCLYSAPTWAPFSATERFINSTKTTRATLTTAAAQKTSK